jgi:hypothetical protein
MRTLNINLLIFLSFFVFSCEGPYEEVGDSGGSSAPTKAVKSMTVSLPSGSHVINTEIVFKVLSDLGEDITAFCKFFVDGVEISGSKFTASKEGDYEVYCTYKELKSNSVTFKVVGSSNPPETFRTNVLVEDYTGAWCGYCPRVAFKLDKLWKSTDEKITPLAIHDNNGMVGADPFHFTKVSELKAKFWLRVPEAQRGYPLVMYNRKEKWYEDDKTLTDLIAIPSNLGLALESSIDGRKLSLKVKVKFGIDFSDLKLVVYLTEYGLKAPQRTYGDLGYGEGTDGYLTDFVHDNVLRASISSLFGDAIDASSLKKGNIFEKSYSYDIPAAYDLENLEIKAFVVDKEDISINSRNFLATGNEAENGKFEAFE